VYLLATIGGMLAWAVVVALCLIVISLILSDAPLQDATEMLLSGLSPMLVSLPAFLWTILITWIFVRVWDRRPFSSIGLASERPWLEWLRGMGLGAGLLILSVAISAVLGWIQFEGVGGAQDDSHQWIGYALVSLAFFLIQGPAEEIQCRGYLLPVLGARGGLWIGILGSSLIFAFQHALNPSLSVLAMINLMLAGIFFALYALVEGGLWGVFGFHTAWNWTQGSLLGLEVSGDQMIAAHPIFDLVETGPDWFTGGAFGPEGGLAVTLILAASIAFLWFRLRSRK
jgi:membrane protease YdiL (CAAX protease family)